MADQIAMMNHGVVEQIGTPQEIYDRPATHVRRRLHRLAADEFPPLRGRGCGAASAASSSATPSVDVPELHEDGAGAIARARRAAGACVASPMPAPLRGRVFGAEYLGTTQIVTVDTAHGQIKARLPSTSPVRLGETVGLAFQPERLVAVRRGDAAGRMRSALASRAARHG